MKRSKLSGCLIPIAIVVVGLFIYFILTQLSGRFSALGACDKSEGCLFTAVNGNRAVRIVGYSADGSRFLTDGTADAIIHDASNGRKVADLDEGLVNHSYSISGDRSEILAYGSDGVLFFDWDGELLRTWTPDEGRTPRDVVMLPFLDGFATADGTGVALWFMSDGNQITQLYEGGGLNMLAASADGRTLAAYDFVDDKIMVWPLEDLDSMVTLSEVEALTMALSDDGSLLVAGGGRGGFLWDTAEGTTLLALEPTGQKATAAGVSGDGSLMAAGFENGQVLLVDVASGELLTTLEHEYQPRRISFAPDSSAVGVSLTYNATVSGGDLIFEQQSDSQPTFRPGESLRTSDNRISVSPGYVVVWSTTP